MSLEMIYDRTAQDVQDALAIRRDKVQRGEMLTPSEFETMERGFVTADTLNRIEEAQETVAWELYTYLGIDTPDIKTKQWGVSDIFKGSELHRFVHNLDELVGCFTAYPIGHSHPPTPYPPNVGYTWQFFNAVENILADLDELANNTISAFKHCGEEFCGGDFG